MIPAAFRTHVLDVRGVESAGCFAPVRLLGSISFLYLRSNDVYTLLVTKRNANAAMAMAFMKQVRASRTPSPASSPPPPLHTHTYTRPFFLTLLSSRP